jgi:hypothetical protein
VASTQMPSGTTARCIRAFMSVTHIIWLHEHPLGAGQQPAFLLGQPAEHPLLQASPGEATSTVGTQASLWRSDPLPHKVRT